MRCVATRTALGGIWLVAGFGCVQQDAHDRTLLTARTQDEQIVRLQQELDVATANLTTAKTEIESLEGEIGQLETAIDTEARKSERWMRRVSQFGPLPLELEIALEQLANQYPEVLGFDPGEGVLRFSSDFTFDLGSVQLKPEAAATIATLAGILNDVEASAFELYVIGHTDNVPVQRPVTRQKHPTNVHLAVHRAISVRDSLVDAGVEPARMLVAGYGPYRPMVANGPKGAPENRRVELLLVPLARHGADTMEPAREGVLTDAPSK